MAQTIEEQSLPWQAHHTQTPSIFEASFERFPYPAVVVTSFGEVVACNRRAAQTWWKTDKTQIDALIGTNIGEIIDLPTEELMFRLRRGVTKGDTKLPFSRLEGRIGRDGVSLRVALLRSMSGGQAHVLLTEDILRTNAAAFSRINLQRSQATEKVKELSYQSAHLEQSLATSRIFTNAASHDLRGPLGNLTTLLNMFSDRFCDEMPDKAQQYVDAMKEAASRLQDLSLCLLDYANAAYGTIDLETVELTDLLTELRCDLTADLKACGGTFEIDARRIELRAQPQLLRSVLANLCANAVKYRSPDRPLELRVTAFYVTGADLLILVQDNGRGFDPAEAERIFLPFERLSTEVDGTGIGLATSAEICRRHGWILSGTGLPNVGAEFSVLIPQAAMLA